MNGGIEALETPTLAAGPEPVMTQAALRALLSVPVTNRVNWTQARLADEIVTREGMMISKSQLSKALRKKGLSLSPAPPHAEGRQDAAAVDRGGLSETSRCKPRLATSCYCLPIRARR
jgi:transposase